MTEFETQINGEILKMFISIQFKCVKQSVYNDSINIFFVQISWFRWDAAWDGDNRWIISSI